MPILLKSKKAPKEVVEITLFSIYSSNYLSLASGIRLRMIVKQFENSRELIDNYLTNRYKTERNNCPKYSKQKYSCEIPEELFLLDLETDMELEIIINKK